MRRTFKQWWRDIRRGYTQADIDLVLQKMRDASKTGGAVGQVTEREWPRLESFLGNLNTVQTTEQFKKRLGEVKERLNKIKAEMKRAYDSTYGGTTQPDGWNDL